MSWYTWTNALPKATPYTVVPKVISRAHWDSQSVDTGRSAYEHSAMAAMRINHFTQYHDIMLDSPCQYYQAHQRAHSVVCNLYRPQTHTGNACLWFLYHFHNQYHLWRKDWFVIMPTIWKVYKVFTYLLQQGSHIAVHISLVWTPQLVWLASDSYAQVQASLGKRQRGQSQHD